MTLTLAVVVAVMFLAGVAVGGLAFRRRAPDPVGAQPVCGCTHHLSMHDPETGHCHDIRVQRSFQPKGDGHSYDKEDPCPCRRYVGPEPLRLVWAEPLAIDPGSGVTLRKIGNPA